MSVEDWRNDTDKEDRRALQNSTIFAPGGRKSYLVTGVEWSVLCHVACWCCVVFYKEP